MPSDTFVSVKQLSRNYGSYCAVDNISFEVKKGEVLGFLGPNGAGKSTTMQILAGNLAPTSGEILIKGVDILANPKAAKAHIGFLPEQPPLYVDLIVDEYLLYCAKLHRIAKAHLATAVSEAKERCGLEEVGHRRIGNLSKGYQQRVGIAQAIIHTPDIVILDEPTVGLDPIQIREIRQLIKQLGGEHSVILSSHILPEIQSICDRVQIISHGKLVFNDDVSALQQQVQIASLTLGLHRAPAVAEIENIAGVASVQAVDDKLFTINFDPSDSPAETLAQICVDKNWGLFQLSPQQQSLEEIFVQLTTTETVEPDIQKEAVAS